MKVRGTRDVALSDIKVNLFVRKELDTDHAFYLGQLIEDGVEMKDLIEVTIIDDEFVMVDGRHRKEGYELAKVEYVKVRVLEFDSEIEMIAYAYTRNTGGSKPPTTADTEHTISLLLEKRESIKAIAEALGLPAPLARKYVNMVKSKLARMKLQRAVNAVTEGGLNIKQSAEQYDVDPTALKDLISGRRKKHKEGVADLQRNLTRLYKSLSLKNAKMFGKLIDQLEDNDVTVKQVTDIFKHVEDLQRRQNRSLAEWKSRFEAKNKNGKLEEVA